jgi:glycine oxidase
MNAVSSGCNQVPRDDGRILVGATVVEVGVDSGPTASGLGGLFTAAGRVLPTLLSQPVAETWAGFRPGTPDERPILGSDPDASGLFYATGHFRNGILFAPVTARSIADAITGHAVPALVEFSVARFRP